MSEEMRLVDYIVPNSKVTIITPHGNKRTGRAVMKSSPAFGGWVLDGGGKYGTPILANDENILEVKAPKGGSLNVRRKADD